MPDLLVSPAATVTGPASSVGTLRLPPRIHIGYGARAQVARVVPELGRRALVVVDPFLAGSPLLAEVVDALAAAGVATRTYADIAPELPVATLDAAAAAAREHRADVVVAIGGGSTLDAAKVVALLAVHAGPLSRYYGENLVPGPVLPVVAVPTTAGTGSEVTPVAVVSDPERELKVGISSPHLVPAAAVVDPELTLGAPTAVTAFSGIDALVHAVESFTARPLPADWGEVLPVFTGSNVLAAAAALEAAGHLGPALPVVVDRPDDRAARLAVATGSLLAGIAFGSTGTHLCHALQYPLGAMTKTPHGLGTGLLLPYVVDAVADEPGVEGQLVALGAALEAIPLAEASVGRLLSRLVAIDAQIGVPPTLADLGVERGQLPGIAELGLRSARLLAVAPLDPTKERLVEILESAHAGHLTPRSH